MPKLDNLKLEKKKKLLIDLEKSIKDSFNKLFLELKNSKDEIELVDKFSKSFSISLTEILYKNFIE
jgi:hypothetical protein